MAHVGIAKVVGTHYVGLIPDGIALEVAVVVEVKVDLFLDRGMLKERADAVEFGLAKQERRREGEKE
jgi:hypothetical protein